MQITINGEPKTIDLNLTIEQLIAQLQVDIRLAAVEKNRIIVPKSRYSETRLEEGDELEIVSFMGGG